MSTSSSTKLWQPSSTQIAQALITDFAKQYGVSDNNYQALYEWSIGKPEQFWSSVWDFCGIVGHKGERVFQASEHMINTRWFPDARLNYAENCLKGSGGEDALVFYGEEQVSQRLSFNELRGAVSQCQQALIAQGVGKGDRVAAILPNNCEAIMAMLATASIGAVWCSASPDFGVDGVLDRVGQIQPKVLFCVDGYYYNGKWIDCTAKNQAVCDQLTSVVRRVCVSYHGGNKNKSQNSSENEPSPADDDGWFAFCQPFTAGPISFEPVDFDHPLFIMFSSGTTGKPKCIVHGTGGTLLQHMKEHQLHSNIKPGDRLFYFTTCGWMMWNWLASGLASGATLVLYDGNPFAGKQQLLFDIADREQLTHFGTSAKFIEACNKAGLEPKHTHKLSALRAVFSTGSPLAPESFRYVYSKIKRNVHLASISGGTDIISCFALGNPTQAVWLGELQCLGLGMAVNAFDANGQATNSKGDLVCTQSFPSMPIGFWNDGGQQYKAAYFEAYDNIWCHGDFIELVQHADQTHCGMIIHGRSDAVLNPGGVRIGTAEIYRQVDKIDSVMESIVIGQQWKSDVRVVLFVKLAEHASLDDELRALIKHSIRTNATPRHVPSIIISVPDIPRTKSGKIVELAVRDVVHGRAIKNQNSLANPEALNHFKNRPELLS